jgi:hypothetical protein
MRKRTIAAVIACILAIILLAALAFIISGTLNGGNDPLYNLLHPGSPQSNDNTDEFGGFIYSTEKEPAVTAAQTEPEGSASAESEYSSTEEEVLPDDGSVKDQDALIEGVKADWAEFIPKKEIKGADPENPPKVGNAPKGANPRAVQIAKERHERLYGKSEE